LLLWISSFFFLFFPSANFFDICNNILITVHFIYLVKEKITHIRISVGKADVPYRSLKKMWSVRFWAFSIKVSRGKKKKKKRRYSQQQQKTMFWDFPCWLDWRYFLKCMLLQDVTFSCVYDFKIMFLRFLFYTWDYRICPSMKFVDKPSNILHRNFLGEHKIGIAAILGSWSM
jgi:hypothetical protein